MRTLAAIPNLDALFSARVYDGVQPPLADERGAVVFDAPPVGSWTITLDRGRVLLARGRSARPRSTITADPATLAAVLDGRISGVEAFLDHGLTVRGDLAFALQIDGAFDIGERPLSHPVVRVVTALGVRTSYLEAGRPDAPPVVLLHGLGGTNASMLPLLPDLVGDHRVIAPDLPGFGGSDAPRWRYRASELAAWLDAFCECVQAPRVTLIGNSLGGRVALELALRRPDLVERLILLCPSPAFRRLRQFAPVVRLLMPDALLMPYPMPHRAVVMAIRSLFAEPDRLPARWYDAAADEHRRLMRRYRHRRAFYSALREIYLDTAYGTEGFWDRLPRLTPPALFVWGAQDWLVPAAFSRHVSEAVPTAQCVVLDDCGHVPQFEHPERTAALIRDFLSAQGSS